MQPAVLQPDVRPGLIDDSAFPGRFRRARFWVEGVVGTAYGDAPVAVRSSAPYHVYASDLERIVVRGSGTVTGLVLAARERRAEGGEVPHRAPSDGPRGALLGPRRRA